MASESSVMAVIRASPPSHRNPHDKVAFTVHVFFLASGFSLISVGRRALEDNPPIVSKTTWRKAAAGEQINYRVMYKNLQGLEKVDPKAKCAASEDLSRSARQPRPPGGGIHLDVEHFQGPDYM